MYPHAVESFEKLPLSEATQRKILGANRRRLYGIEPWREKKAPR